MRRGRGLLYRDPTIRPWWPSSRRTAQGSLETAILQCHSSTKQGRRRTSGGTAARRGQLAAIEDGQDGCTSCSMRARRWGSAGRYDGWDSAVLVACEALLLEVGANNEGVRRRKPKKRRAVWDVWIKLPSSMVQCSPRPHRELGRLAEGD